MRFRLLALAISLAFPAFTHAAPTLIATGSLNGTADLSGLTNTLENGVSNAVLGGIGSGLAWAGGSTFLALPDRGPNAKPWNSAVDNTTSYVSRFQTVNLALTQSDNGGKFSYTLAPSLSATTLLYSSTPLNYGETAPIPPMNSAGKYYFDGRSDNFRTGLSTNANNARLDPEGIRVSNNGSSVFISDEYGPYVYQFNRATGERVATFSLPPEFSVSNQAAQGATEISNNTSGRVANKGMEGLAITPDGKTLIGFMQSPLAQDGGDGGRANRIVTIDIATGETKQFVYDNFLADKNKAYNSSEILAINSHEFLVLERDGKGMGDGSSAAVKRIYKIDLINAKEIGLNIQGEAELLKSAVSKTLFLDLRLALNQAGLKDAEIPAKLEGMAFGEDIFENGQRFHTLYVANDNDFVADIAGSNQFYVFKVSDADLGTSSFANQQIPEPGSLALALGGLGLLGLTRRLRSTR